MPLNKVYSDARVAMADVFDGAVIMVGGFGVSSTPQSLIKALMDRGAKDLVCICNACRLTKPDQHDVSKLVERGQVKKVITTFSEDPDQWIPAEELWRQSKLEVEIVPQGILVERIRAAGAGIGGFFISSPVATPVDQDREKRIFDGEECILEMPLRADFALIRAYRADPLGNLVYRLTQRNYNPEMVTAADVTIAEVRELVQVGHIDPEEVITPGIFVDRVVVAGVGL